MFIGLTTFRRLLASFSNHCYYNSYNLKIQTLFPSFGEENMIAVYGDTLAALFFFDNLIFPFMVQHEYYLAV
mgnify:CR=1 FL=1